MRKYRVVIPSWAPLNAEMQAETGSLYPAFVQLGGQPLYAHIINSYEDIKKDAEIVVVLPQNSPELNSKYLDGFHVRSIHLSESQNIGQTILAALSGLDPEQTVVVHMADTLVSPLELSSVETNALYVQLRSDTYRWTSVLVDEAGVVRVVTDRDHLSAGIESTVCVGVFLLSKGLQFSTHLESALAEPKLTMDPFFLAIENYSNQHAMELKHIPSWHDFGHLDSYYESRLNFQNLRHFNTLTYDAGRGLVTKRSNNVEAYRHQIRWFKQVPDELACFLPRIYESDDGEAPYITMELLSLPTVSDLFLNKRLDVGAWNYVVQKISLIQTVFQKYRFRCSIGRQIATEIYVKKTKSRIEQFFEQQQDARNFWIRRSGTKFSLNEVVTTLASYAERNGLLELDTLSPIHGDMCFSNLMYDPRSRHIKLIDPRGEFGVPGIYGDLRYDKAKLMHSYEGGYDFIVTNRFDVSVSSVGEITSVIERSEYHNQVEKIFNKRIFENLQDRKQCDAIQALLFLSMLPLHCDHPERQLAMLYLGLDIYARNFD